MDCKPFVYNCKDKGFKYDCKPRLNKYACIWVDKVFSHCYQKECIRNVVIDLDEYFIKNIEFRPGQIVKGTLKMEDIKGEDIYKRIRYTLRIPYVVIRDDGEEIKGYLPDIYKDITLPFFESREDFNFDVIVETYSKVLDKHSKCNKVLLDVGVIVVTKILGKVQLAVKLPRPKPKFIRVDIPIRKVHDAIIYGRVTECDDGEPIVGATVALFIHKDGKLKKICHSFSGCNGYYMIRVPKKFQGKTATITAVKENCFKDLEPCVCEIIDNNGDCKKHNK